MDSVVTESTLEKMVSILQVNGNLWPPYPENFKIPEGIKSMWISRGYKCLNSFTKMPILRGDRYRRINIGDRFNGVVIQRKRKKGLKFPDRHHRTPQFLFSNQNFSGNIIFDYSLSGAEVIKKGDLRTGEVHRFEIVSVLPDKHIFYCVPLAKVFHKDNLLYNLMNCNYESR